MTVSLGSSQYFVGRDLGENGFGRVAGQESSGGDFDRR